MPVKYIPYQVDPLRGQAVLPFLRYHRQLVTQDFQSQGLPYFEVETVEQVGKDKKSKNLLIHGDCLNACAYLKEQGTRIDLVYIDPPFASGANYAKKIYIRNNPKLVAKLEQVENEIDNADLQTLEETMYGDIWQKEDYLNWIYERLLAIKEIMSDTASIYVHLDSHIGHYVKVILDEIFGEENFHNEIIWHYKSFHGQVQNFLPKKHDVIFFYSKTETYNFRLQRNEEIEALRNTVDFKNWNKYLVNEIEIRGDHMPSDVRFKRYLDKWVRQNGRQPTAEDVVFTLRTQPFDDVWDINYLDPKNTTERTDYATQKPEELLQRILNASSKTGMIVADFFGGSGVTAKVAHDLGRTFITADVGVNAIQTMRDRLVEAGASFDMLKVKDGIDLFRNPAQTMDKLSSIIPNLTTSHEFGKFWFGAMTDGGQICPCWVPNLLDKTQAILNPALMGKILDETVKLEGVSKVIVCSINLVDEPTIKKMIKDYDIRDAEGKQVQFIFKDLKELTDLLSNPDSVEYEVKLVDGKYKIIFKRLISDYLINKVTEFNAKKQSIDKQVEISEEGLELVEFVSVDCTSIEGIWHSDHEIKIDIKGYLITDGDKSKNRWDGTLTVDRKPKRFKIRNIAGDETIIVV